MQEKLKKKEELSTNSRNIKKSSIQLTKNCDCKNKVLSKDIENILNF